MPRLADIAPESILLAGAGRAILLQIANPAIGYGVARHSDFALHPMKRLNATLSYVYALANGSDDDIRAMRRAVNRAHAPVSNPPRGAARSAAVADLPAATITDGIAPAQPAAAPAIAGHPDAHHTDPRYDARDPQLQLWVAATLYDTAITLYEKTYGPLAPDAAEHVYREYAVLGTALQMPLELWPETRADFRAYWDHAIAGLRVDATVRSVAAALLRAQNAPLALRAGMPLARFVTVALLPDALRGAFGFTWSKAQQRRFDRLMAVSTRVYRVLPTRVRRWPSRRYLARIRVTYGAGTP